ncbi:TIGR03936 family radical SAM-associated protein [Anaerovorax sp. IOR16]|uniref:TIGR03936 family radical SAM-associated protein n=1 Tax=Anaerovorax sp. IOR16 TaxID=2773458 RepID=UPI0019D06C46|nr:TIGR03936 family radical SAM-associated protein [Anaerovorax sp. IOR16]
MSRYVLQFYKQGYMKYISHLDLLRLFKRSFKRMEIKLQHSQGFNPHPKMSFVQPLSLGYTSVSEYLEFETNEYEEPNHIIQKLNEAMPDGIGIAACRAIPPSKKTLAAMVEYASYELKFKTNHICDWNEKLEEFLQQDKIIILKKQKKSKNLVEQDIKPMIRDIILKDSIVDNNIITLTTTISAGSNFNLNPENLMKSFCTFLDIPFEKEAISIERKELYCSTSEGNGLVPILKIEFKN